jgi:hypothetical protein
MDPAMNTDAPKAHFASAKYLHHGVMALLAVVAAAAFALLASRPLPEAVVVDAIGVLPQTAHPDAGADPFSRAGAANPKQDGPADRAARKPVRRSRQPLAMPYFSFARG